MTVDVEISSGWAPPTTPPEVPDPATDDGALLGLARSRMLTYYFLSGLPTGARSLSPIGQAVADPASWRRRAGLVYPLERDPSTQEERLLARDATAYADLRPPAQRIDMLTGRVPGTDVVVGMSRRLFEACRDLTADEEQIAGEAQLEEVPPEAGGYLRPQSEDDVDEYLRERRTVFAAHEAASRPRLRAAARRGFERGSRNLWHELMPDELFTINTDPQPGLLESATADTYLAIDIRSVPP